MKTNVLEYDHCVHDSSYNLKSTWKTANQAINEAKRLAGKGAEMARSVHDGEGGKILVFAGPNGEFAVSNGSRVDVR
jgi:hypothetical protein